MSLSPIPEEFWTQAGKRVDRLIAIERAAWKLKDSFTAVGTSGPNGLVVWEVDVKLMRELIIALGPESERSKGT